MMKNVGQRNETEYLQLAGLQHFSFCRRQWALIHIEQQWAENYFTVDGAIKHTLVDEGLSDEKMGKKRVLRSLPVVSHELGIQGVCDAVELIEDEGGAYFSKYDARFIVYPVEYKRGKTKTIESDILQLTAQAMCLEEMMEVRVSQGAVFYFETRRREKVEFTDELRATVRNMAAEMNKYYRQGYTPKVRKSAKCRACSLQDICLPGLQKLESARSYVERMLGE